MIFTIKKGRHFSGQWLYKLLNWRAKPFRCTISFDKSCKYYIGMPDQLDVNKLIGFSLSSNHHSSSVRFGWRSQGDKIHIYAYSYVEGSRIIEEMGSVSLEEEFTVSLEKLETDFVYTLFLRDGTKKEFYMKMVPTAEPLYMLWPYFGGNQPAPNNMKINITTL